MTFTKDKRYTIRNGVLSVVAKKNMDKKIKNTSAPIGDNFWNNFRAQDDADSHCTPKKWLFGAHITMYGLLLPGKLGNYCDVHARQLIGSGYMIWTNF